MADLLLQDVTRGVSRRLRVTEQDSLILGADHLAPGPVYVDPVTGFMRPASAAAAPTAGVRGIVAKPGKNRDGRTLYRKVLIDGYDLSGLAYDQLVYLSDNAGKLADAAGTVSVVVGRVTMGAVDELGGAPKKLLRLDL